MSLFGVRLFAEKPHKLKDSKTFGKFIWSLYCAKRDQENMYGYFIEQSSCEDLSIGPSKKLRKRYNIDPSSSNAFIFGLMERYFESRQQVKKIK